MGVGGCLVSELTRPSPCAHLNVNRGRYFAHMNCLTKGAVYAQAFFPPPAIALQPPQSAQR